MVRVSVRQLAEGREWAGDQAGLLEGFLQSVDCQPAQRTQISTSFALKHAVILLRA